MREPTLHPQDNPYLAPLRSARLKSIASWLLFPFCLPQGALVRARQMRLVPPAGDAIRRVGEGDAKAPYRLLVLGDSTVAGVGTSRLDDGLAVQLAQRLSTALGRQVALHIAGNSSATSAEIRDHVLRHLPRNRYDLVVLVIGVNDAKNLHTASRFARAFGTLIYALKTRFPGAVIAHCPIVPLSVIPLLPQPLKLFLRWRSDVIDAYAACLCASRGVVRFHRHLSFPREGFAADGFHVHALGCALWADDLVDQLMQMPQVTAARRAG